MKKLMVFLVFCVVLSLASCSDNDSSTPAPTASAALKTAPFAEIPLEGENVAEYTAPDVETLEVSDSDVFLTIVSYTMSGGYEILFYEAQDHVIYGAYRKNDGILVRFFTQDAVYKDGYDIKPYMNVLGQTGFYIVCPRGSAYTAYDYYYFEPDGALKILAQCSNYVIENDFNGDGAAEIVWYYNGGREVYYYFKRDNKICAACLSAMLNKALPEWEKVNALPFSADEGTIEITYSLKDEEYGAHKAEMLIADDTVEIYLK